MLNAKVQGQNEQTIIHQAVERLVQMLWQASSEKERALNALSYERALRDAPSVTSRDLIDRIQVLEQKLEDLGKENDKLRDYMRLKDQAKLKMDSQIRDFKSEIRDLKDQLAAAAHYRDVQHSAIAELKTQNAKQATAYKDLEAELAAALNNVVAHAERVKALEEVIVLGRRGLESEKAKWA